MNSINRNINSMYEFAPKNVRFGANGASAPTLPDYMPPQAQTQDVELPDMYYMPENYKRPKTFKEKVKKADALGLISQWFEHPLLMLGTCAGISIGIDAFDKSCNKEYEKSIIGKAANFGDKIENSKFIQSEPSQKTLQGIKGGWKKFRDFALKNSVIYSMVKTPSQPEWSMPKDELKHTDFRIVNKFKELTRALDIVPNESGGFEGFVDKFTGKKLNLKALAVDKEELEYLKKTYNVSKISNLPEEECVNRLNLRRIGKTEEEIANILSGSNPTEAVKEEIFNKMGLTREELMKIMADETGETIDIVKKASANLKGLKINNFPLFGFLKTPGIRQPLANVESFENVFNRAHSITVGVEEGAKTKTGKFMSKLLQKLHRGFTFGGTKFGVMLFVAPLLVETMVNTKKADKKEKIGTAVGGFVEAISWVFTFPLVLVGIHAYGGIQYAGMGKEKVAEYRRLVNEFNAKVLEKDPEKRFKSYNEYRDAKRALKEELKKLRRVENQSLFTGTLRGLSRFTKADLLSIESYRGDNTAMNIVRRLPDFVINKFGYSFARFLVFMLVGMPLADKVIKKCTSTLFGKAYDAEREEEHAEAKERQEEYTMNDLRERMLEAQKEKLYPTPEPEETPYNQPEMPNPAVAGMLKNNTLTETPQQEAEISTENITEQPGKTEQISSPETIKNIEEINSNNAQQEPIDNYDYIPAPINTLPKNDKSGNEKLDNYTYIPSSENVLNTVSMQDRINKYIPAQTGVQLNKTFDNSGLEAALRRAERAERRAISTLAGNFGSAD